MKTIKAGNGEVWVEGDILMVKMTGELTLEKLEEIAKTGISLAGKYKFRYVLVDSDVTKMHLSARKAVSAIVQVPVEKVALICGNPVTRAIATFIMRGFKLQIPTRILSNAEEARKWFREGENGGK